MEIQGEYRFAATPDRVFDTLPDPRALERSLPGCEEFREERPGPLSRHDVGEHHREFRERQR